MPEKFVFQTEIPVRITDINYGNHVGNDSILSIIHEIRVRFLVHHNLSEKNFGGVGIIMSDVAIEFKKELFYGDIITAHVAISDFSNFGFNIYYKLEKKTEATATTVANAKTGIVCYDYALGKLCPIPIVALEQLKMH